MSAPGASARLGQRAIRGGAWALLGRALALPAVLVLAMMLARLLEPAAVGAYFLAMSLLVLLASLAQAGMARPMVKLVAAALATGRPAAARHAVQLALAVTVGAGGLLALALADGPGAWLVSGLADGARLREVLPTLALLLLALALIDLVAETLRGFHDLRAASLLADLLAQRLLLASALLLAWLAAVPMTLGAVFGVALATAVVVLGAALLILCRRVSRLGREGERWRSADVLRHGPPFLMVRINLWLLAGADLWALGLFRAPDEVAVYGAASRLALLVGVPLMICNGVVAPMVAELHSRGDHARLERLLRTAATLAALPALALVLLFALFGRTALELIFTEAYGDGYPIVVILALGQWTNVTLGSCAISLTMTGHQQVVVAAGILASLVTVAGYLLAAPVWGALGVGVVTAFSLAFYNGLLAIAAWRRLGIRTWARPSPLLFRRLAAELREMVGARL